VRVESIDPDRFDTWDREIVKVIMSAKDHRRDRVRFIGCLLVWICKDQGVLLSMRLRAAALCAFFSTAFLQPKRLYRHLRKMAVVNDKMGGMPKRRKSHD